MAACEIPVKIEFDNAALDRLNALEALLKTTNELLAATIPLLRKAEFDRRKSGDELHRHGG